MSCWPHPARSSSLWSGWRMRISTSGSEVKVLNLKWVVCPLVYWRGPSSSWGVQGPQGGVKEWEKGDGWIGAGRSLWDRMRHVGGTMSLSWSGNASESSWKSWRGCSEGSLVLDCFLCDPAPEKQTNTDENLNYWLQMKLEGLERWQTF